MLRIFGFGNESPGCRVDPAVEYFDHLETLTLGRITETA